MSIVVSDFDNTILDKNYLNNINAIKNFVSRGNTFIIATGRNIESIKSEVDKYNIPVEYYICNDGAVIYDKYLTVIYRKDIDEYIAKEIIKILNNDLNIAEAFIDNTNGYSKDIRNVNKIIAKPIDMHKAEFVLSRIVKSYPCVIGYLSKHFININNNLASKGNALKYLVNFYHLDENEIYTIGDGVNDIDLISNYLGFTVSSAIDDLKSSSYKTVSSLEELLNRL